MYLPLLLELKFRIEKLEAERLETTIKQIEQDAALNSSTLEEIFNQNCSCNKASALMNLEQFKTAVCDLLNRLEPYFN